MLFQFSKKWITVESSTVRHVTAHCCKDALTNRATWQAALECGGESRTPVLTDLGRWEVALVVSSELMFIYRPRPGLSPLGNGMILTTPCLGEIPWNARVCDPRCEPRRHGTVGKQDCERLHCDDRTESACQMCG